MPRNSRACLSMAGSWRARSDRLTTGATGVVSCHQSTRKYTAYYSLPSLRGCSRCDRLARSGVGLRERMRISGPGRGQEVAHAEMELADGLIMIGVSRTAVPQSEAIGSSNATSIRVRGWCRCPLQRAKEAGAKIVEELKDQFGDRRYEQRTPKDTAGISPSTSATYLPTR